MPVEQTTRLRRTAGRPRKSDALTPAERSRRARAAKAGTVALTRTAADALDAIVERDGDASRVTALERVLLAAAPPAA